MKKKLLIYGIFALALRCGPNKVSIKASSSVLCNGNTTFFAFGVA